MKILHEIIASFLVCASLCVAGLRFDVDTGNDLHVLKVGEESQLFIRIHNDTQKSVTSNVTYQVTDIDGNVVASATVEALVAAQEWILVPLAAPEKLGPYTLRCIEGAGDVREQAPIRFVYMNPSGPRAKKDVSGFLFGNTLHYDYRMYTKDKTDYFRVVSDEEYDRATKAMAWCGANVIRTGCNMHMIMPDREGWTPHYLEVALESLKKYNLGCEAQIFHGARWAISRTWTPVDPQKAITAPWCSLPDYDDWRLWTHKLLAHYGDQFDFMEVLNEINGGINYTPEEYGELMRIVYEEVKAVAPHVKVSPAGLMSLQTNRVNCENWYGRFAAAVKNYCDMECYHQHGNLGGLLAEHALVKAFREKEGMNKPFWYNEIGYAACSENDELAQAQALFYKVLYVWSQGGVGYNWYNVRDKPQAEYDETSAEPHFGMLTRDFHPKPVYSAFNTITGNLFNATFIADLNEDSRAGASTYAYLFKNEQPDTYTMTFFRFGADSTMQIAQKVTGRAFVIDLWGNETELDVNNGIVSFAIGNRPMMIRFTEQTAAPELAGEFLSANGLILYPGNTQEIAFPVKNPTANEMTVTITLGEADGLVFTPAQVEKTLKPGENNSFVFSCTVAQDFKDSILAVEFDAGDFCKGTSLVTLISALKAAAEFPDAPSFMINSAEQNVRLVAVSPEDEPFYWKGPEDCSAKVWIAQAENRLKFHIEVTDDAHAQPWHGMEVWRGDNVQLGIQIPRQGIYWEIGLTHCDDGMPETFVWFAPAGFDKTIAANRIKLNTSRNDENKVTVYDAEIPFNAIGLTPAIGKSGFLFNMLVNDCDDGKTREGFMTYKPGLGDSKETSAFSKICF